MVVHGGSTGRMAAVPPGLFTLVPGHGGYLRNAIDRNVACVRSRRRNSSHAPYSPRSMAVAVEFRELELVRPVLQLPNLGVDLPRASPGNMC